MAQELAKALILKNQPKLEALSSKVNGIHQEILASARATVMRAVEAGKWLVDMKELLPHGHFEKYIDEHTNLGGRTARRYMLLNEKWPLIEKELGPDAYVSTIDGCLKIVQPPAPPKPAPKVAKLADIPPSEEPKDEPDGSEDDSDLGLDSSIAEAARLVREGRAARAAANGDGNNAEGRTRSVKSTIKAIEANLERLFGEMSDALEDYQAAKPDSLHFDCQQGLDHAYGDFRKWKRK